MIDPGPLHPQGEARLAELTEEITGRLLAGESFDAESYLARHPSCAGPILDLLPTIHDLADLGRTLASGRRRPAPRPAQPPRREGPLP
ncbi:hypothetical protein OJF2_33660 [Aquisphaera giovannonii]|uniref:Uncharacterized protein n=1 Tax=Aquisphaera giovannonii TaxID=406548 RepID=A0A5B9W3Y0_9BACT|nr:hypothetical protein [Aquisphaera giovannonii]QEH34821.1 hypothetical protein OJF2_33660 [Aquisphaera giovannonii]